MMAFWLLLEHLSSNANLLTSATNATHPIVHPQTCRVHHKHYKCKFDGRKLKGTHFVASLNKQIAPYPRVPLCFSLFCSLFLYPSTGIANVLMFVRCSPFLPPQTGGSNL